VINDAYDLGEYRVLTFTSAAWSLPATPPLIDKEWARGRLGGFGRWPSIQFALPPPPFQSVFPICFHRAAKLCQHAASISMNPEAKSLNHTSNQAGAMESSTKLCSPGMAGPRHGEEGLNRLGMF
jgi:hypothetical protein